jgi:RNA-directed DNA polymerase
MRWDRYCSVFDRWVPYPRVLHPYPSVRFDAMHPR